MLKTAISALCALRKGCILPDPVMGMPSLFSPVPQVLLISKSGLLQYPLLTVLKNSLLQNLFDPSISADMFRGLYFLRWPVESKYMELKECLQLESFNGATAISIMQEFFLNMLLSNLVSLIKGQVDESIDSRANPKNKYRYQANRAFIIGQLKKVLPRILNKVSDLALLDTVIDYAYRCRSQIQPGRSNKRRIQNGVRRTHFNNRKVAF